MLKDCRVSKPDREEPSLFGRDGFRTKPNNNGREPRQGERVSSSCLAEDDNERRRRRRARGYDETKALQTPPKLCAESEVDGAQSGLVCTVDEFVNLEKVSIIEDLYFILDMF